VRQGERVYAGKSFSRDPVALIAEVRAECADLAGWAWVLDCRLADLEAAAAEVLRQPASPLVVVRRPMRAMESTLPAEPDTTLIARANKPAGEEPPQ
jgi:hypothetical protein